MIDPDELGAWLRLIETEGIGRGTALALLRAFGSPQGVFQAPAAALESLLPAPLAKALLAPPPRHAEQLERTLDWLRASPQHHVVTLGDAAYPPLLLDTEDPPLLLYGIGHLALLQRDAIAVVGSRNPTRQGLDNARAFSRHLSQWGWTIVSGLALGIDGAAHEGALEGAGSTVAVVGTGLDRVYPRRHLSLAHRIALDGLLLSEYRLGTPPVAANFPQRNRIISGLSRGTLVVEAALRSGSLITARTAADQGREVFAIPGSIHSPLSRGCHALIRQGAKLVEDGQDILEELGLPQARLDFDVGTGPDEPAPLAGEGDGRDDAPAATRPGSATAGGSRPADALLDALGHDPATLDMLAERTGCAAAELSAQLLELELDGRVARLPGSVFQRVGRA